MDMESQHPIDSQIHPHPIDTQIHPHSENISAMDRDAGVTSCSLDQVEHQKIEKRPTRQWAAWTRQEEESFFTALRQVGKAGYHSHNFEKITRRVQSKNKDQVRHYYYRLVRRMNKLLGPGLCLDAKNSKDTNAAMLRWWSLLEKYSCKASKLHLKPRRFKIFVEALESQLLKDRKKNVRRRSSQSENGSPTAPSTITNQNRQLGQESRTVKLVLVDSQNIQKLGAGKASLKRNISMGVIRGNNKGDSTAIRPARQRRKQGLVSSAAYKKWEKAAIAGVSLVADAAEHLERTTTNEVEHGQDMAGMKDLDPMDKVLPPLPASLHHVESNVHASMKLKLQLFPIDDVTRRALEMDNHNPHLELTLSTRKKISSVLEHLNRKWGNSSVASGELMLFPYSVNRENLAGYERWKQDSNVSAADVYSSIGSPPVFRLRYGWFSNPEFGPASLQVPSVSGCISDGDIMDIQNKMGKTLDPVPIYRPSDDDISTTVSKNDALALSSHDVSDGMSGYITIGSRDTPVNSTDPRVNISWHSEANGDGANMKLENGVFDYRIHDSGFQADLRFSNGAALSAGEWADTLTNISVGDLLSEVPHDANPSDNELPIAQSDQCLQQIPFSCDSFDAAIAAHLSKHQNKMAFSSTITSHASSIWDAEDTCDAFSFQKNRALCQEVPTSSSVAPPQAGKQMEKTNSTASISLVEELPDTEGDMDVPADKEEPMDECPSDPKVMDNSTKDFAGLTDIYWPDSLGLLDLDIMPSKYHSEDLFLGDSLGSLNHLIASSLDAFQSCSFLGLNKKDSSSMVEARETASFADFKVGSGV
ncbi:hypothetical protein Tsubulata_038958 [Turnera subulata]|uniref:SANT domain-containing protein n=1 Tax=Turnera subulata TaxID=218843 RepID=A0A9Q0GFC6_9ROSI|nr:hypothetical protein Tsubulata_038958 [Turnera subulata]